MNSLLLFVPLAIWLLAVLVGFVCAVAAVVGMRKPRPALQRQQAQTPQPPVLSGGTQHIPSASGCRTLFLRGLLVLGLGTLAVGVLGVWSAKVSIGYLQKPAPEWSDGHAPALEPLIRRHCVPFVTQGKSVGLAVAVVTPTNATIMTFGHPSLTAAGPTRADTLFEIGSITKTFTGLALARQIEQGIVRLDQPVQELLPPNAELPEEGRGITLRHLTTHSSGFPRMPAGWSSLRGLGMVLFGSDPYAGYTAADLLADVRVVKLASKPGSQGCYSNFGMTLLGYLLATRAGSSYEALVKREVCLPLGMKDTTITLDHSQSPRAAQGYRTVWRCGPLVVALRSVPWFEGNDLGGAGALRSTATDMLKYLQANMRPEGQPLEHALRKAHQVLFKEDEYTSYGMNWITVHNQTLKQDLIWHNGGTGGFRSFVGFTADSRMGVLILSNCTEDADDLAVELLRDLIGASNASPR
jgi:CubicO group peptidase (beta-lactamase class C family)